MDFLNRFRHIELSEALITEALLIVYLGTAPVYWFPTIPVILWSTLKLLIFISALGSVLYLGVRQKRFLVPTGFFGLGGFAALGLFMLPGLIQSPASMASLRILDIIYPAIFVLVIYNAVNLGLRVSRVAVYSAVLLAFFNIPVIMASLNLTPLYVNPFDSRFSIYYTGLSGHATGWAYGLALYIPFIMYGAWYFRKSVPILLFFISIFILNFSGQVIVGGRAGILTTFVMVLVFIGSKLSVKAKLILAGIISVAIFGAVAWFQYSFIEQHFRLDRLFGGNGGITLATLDYFSSYRIGQHILAIQGLIDNPFTGYGLERFARLNSGTELHNVWLRLWYENGIFIFISLIFMVRHSLKAKKNKDEEFLYFCRLSMIGGIIISFFEPSVIIGTFQSCAIWWLAYSLRSGEYIEQS